LKKIKNNEYGAVGYQRTKELKVTKELKKTLGIELQNIIPLSGL